MPQVLFRSMQKSCGGFGQLWLGHGEIWHIASVESVERGDRTWLCLAARSPLFRSGSLIRTCCPCGLLLKSVNSTRPSTYTKRTPAAPPCATCACSVRALFIFSILSYNILQHQSYYIIFHEWPFLGESLTVRPRGSEREIPHLQLCVLYLGPFLLWRNAIESKNWLLRKAARRRSIMHSATHAGWCLRSKLSWLLQKTKRSETSVENGRKTWEGSEP